MPGNYSLSLITHSESVKPVSSNPTLNRLQSWLSMWVVSHAISNWHHWYDQRTFIPPLTLEKFFNISLSWFRIPCVSMIMCVEVQHLRLGSWSPLSPSWNYSGCELSDARATNQLWVLCESSVYSRSLSHLCFHHIGPSDWPRGSALAKESLQPLSHLPCHHIGPGD